jgi:hypothetical protein
VSQSRALLSQTESAKDSGHYPDGSRGWSLRSSVILAMHRRLSGAATAEQLSVDDGLEAWFCKGGKMDAKRGWMMEGVSNFLDQFSHLWAGGYYEGDPLDPMAESNYGIYGYNSALLTVYLACIRPYVHGRTVALEIGPGRGAWSKTILRRNPAKLYAVDAAPAEHTRFWEYVGRDPRVEYIVARDFTLSNIPNSSVDFFFSFGVFCHLRPEMCAAYVGSLASKMCPGANGFLMIADFDHYNRCLDEAERTSVLRFFLSQSRKVWLPTKLALYLSWRLFRRKMDLARVSRQAEGDTDWYHWGLDAACASLTNHGFDIVDRDIRAISRDPIIHFRKHSCGAD